MPRFLRVVANERGSVLRALRSSASPPLPPSSAWRRSEVWAGGFTAAGKQMQKGVALGGCVGVRWPVRAPNPLLGGIIYSLGYVGVHSGKKAITLLGGIYAL